MPPASAPPSLSPAEAQVAHPDALGLETLGSGLIQDPALPSPRWVSASLEWPFHSSWCDVASPAGSPGSRLALQSSFIGTWS